MCILLAQVLLKVVDSEGEGDSGKSIAFFDVHGKKVRW